MNKLLAIFSVSLTVSLGAGLTSCNSFSGGGSDGSGGSGATGNGGDTGSGSGGSSATGSGGDTSSGSGGSSATGSGGDTSSGSGGTASTGGTTGSGGTMGSGGTPASGGATGTGGAKGGSSGTTGSGGTPASGGATGSGGVTTTGGTTGSGGAKGGSSGTTGSGGTPASGGTTGSGGATATGGTTGSGGSTASTTPCSILSAAGNSCVAAHSTVRVIYPGYTGPLYQVCKGSSQAGPKSCTGTTMDIGSVSGGVADTATQDSFCSGATCTISIIYDQSPMKNDLHPGPAGGAKATADNPASATALKTTLNGHEVYGILIQPNIGYRAGCTGCGVTSAKGTATGDQAETEYMVTSKNNVVGGCCFDYGNAESDSHDDGNGTMEAVYFGDGVVWGTGTPGGHNNGTSWVMADLENGLYAGWSSSTQDQNITTNTVLNTNFVTAVVVGDSCTGKSGCAGTGSSYPNGRFALYGGDATTGALKTMYDGVRPAKAGYVPMAKQGSIILGIGGDNSDSDGGEWFEGVMASGAATTTTLNSIQANIVAAGYGK
jgi:non-reducing end alpha-L-arabinofuranosidase